jgi:hypothetical protein
MATLNNVIANANGNVGIGTTNPTAKLTIVDNTNGGSINLVGRTNDDTAAINFRANGDASTYAYVAPDTNEFRLYHNDGFMSFYPGGSEKVRITSGGNVGIGTTSPTQVLDVRGNIKLGNKAFGPIQVTVHGKLSVGVKTLDSRADLHVAGAIKFNERLHQYLNAVPDAGTYDRGSIVWNTEPEVGRCVGWVCVRAGSPGTWMPFGEIKQSG